MSRRKRKYRASYDPHCPFCVEGWSKVHGEVLTVRRCHCYKVTRMPEEIPKKLPRKTAQDFKTAAAGGDR